MAGATGRATGGYGMSPVLLPRLERAKWVLNLYESAGEAGGGFVLPAELVVWG